MDKKHIITILISILTTIATIALWAGGVSTQQEINTQNISSLQSDLKKEVEERKSQNTEILVKLAEIDTNVLYIKKAVDKEQK
jgi:hypothetical protein